jgi:tetratricopeptide (TPR) repeat protein
MNNHGEGMKVLHGLLTVLETHHIYPAYPMFQASPFAKKLYQTVLYNLSVHFYNHGDITDAFHYVNKGIAFSTKEYSLRLLPELYEMKLKILYQEENFDEAKICYNHTLHLYKVTRKDVKLAALEDLAKSDYPEVLMN